MKRNEARNQVVHRNMAPKERYALLVRTLLRNPAVSQSERKGFGSSALTIKGKIFAMLDHDNRLTLKFPKERVDALVASGVGERFDPRHDGRLMKEWLTVEPTSKVEWLDLAREAMGFVASLD